MEWHFYIFKILKFSPLISDPYCHIELIQCPVYAVSWLVVHWVPVYCLSIIHPSSIHHAIHHFTQQYEAPGVSINGWCWSASGTDNKSHVTETVEGGRFIMTINKKFKLVWWLVEKVNGLLTHCGLVMPYDDKSGSILAQVMAWCLMAPSHYLNQCWLNH